MTAKHDIQICQTALTYDINGMHTEIDQQILGCHVARNVQ
ncbi:21636_t:CDS:2 [Entrophospora sp. SA101]|nr:21636_t:CDS:2 [Entrophospora sp. SA101]